MFTTGEDPVRQGLVTNLGRPSGNLTGVTFFGGGVLGAKRVELLHDLVPKARAIAVLIDPNYGGSDVELREVETAGRALGRQIVAVRAAREQQFEAAFDKLLEAGADALLIAGGANFNSQRQAIIALAARHALPTMYTSRDYVAAGGLISYSASVANAYRQAGVYAGKILKGTKPSELPAARRLCWCHGRGRTSVSRCDVGVSNDVAEARGAVRADGSLKKAAPFAMPPPVN